MALKRRPGLVHVSHIHMVYTLGHSCLSQRRASAGALFGAEAQEVDSQDTKEKSNEQEMTFDRLGQI